MKIGILTFHRAHNYGAVLQAYGLQEYIKQQGHDVSIIDYSPDYLTNNYRKFSIYNWISKNPIRALSRFLSELVLFSVRIVRWNKFDRFTNERLNLKPYRADKRFSEFDAVVLGSDQIWNFQITGGKFDEVYFGGDAKGRIIAYAASNQSSELSSEEKDFYTDRLSRMYAIGVRENVLQRLLQPLTEIPVEFVIDPTLLAGREVYQKIAVCPKGNKRYVLIYEIVPHDFTYRIARRLADQLNAEIVELVAGPSIRRMRQKRQAVSPEEFVGYFEHAACVVTTSFHGTSFSIMFRKPFYAIRQDKPVDIRLASLLSSIGLRDRFISGTENPEFKEIDYAKTDRLLDRQVESSRSFLNKSLN